MRTARKATGTRKAQHRYDAAAVRRNATLKTADDERARMTRKAKARDAQAEQAAQAVIEAATADAAKPVRYVHRPADRPGLMRVYRTEQATGRPLFESGSYTELTGWFRAKGVSAVFVGTSPVAQGNDDTQESNMSNAPTAKARSGKAPKGEGRKLTVPAYGEKAYKAAMAGDGWAAIGHDLNVKPADARKAAVFYAAANGKGDPVNRAPGNNRFEQLRAAFGQSGPAPAPAAKAPAKAAPAKAPAKAAGKAPAKAPSKAAAATTSKGRKQASKAATKAPAAKAAPRKARTAKQVTPIPKATARKANARNAAVAAAE